jgi:hypothetical protein
MNFQYINKLNQVHIPEDTKENTTHRREKKTVTVTRGRESKIQKRNG